MTITTVFDPPQLSDSREVFDAKAFGLVADLNTFGTEANALQADVNTKQASATAAALDAGTHAAAATAAKNAAESAWDNFDDRYLGPKASNPTLDNDGNALLEGALYWNTTAKEMRAWNGTAWVITSVANALSRTGDTMTGPLAQAAGTASLPSYTFSGDANTGIWSPGADTLAWSTGGSERLRIDTSGQVGIGKTPTQRFDIGFAGTLISQLDSSGATTAATVHRYVASNRTWVTGVNTIDPFGNYTFYDFTAASTRLTIDTTGNVLVTGSGGLGYGGGSGGTVTQATSKSTAVTLNKPSGQITMHNDALAAGATVAFVFNNSLLAVGDALLVTVYSGVSGGALQYQAWGYRCADGTAQIALRNNTAGSLSDAVVLDFKVIKGATS